MLIIITLFREFMELSLAIACSVRVLSVEDTNSLAYFLSDRVIHTPSQFCGGTKMTF
jgi:hypothetical protein